MNQKEVPFSSSNLRPPMSHIHGGGGGGGGGGRGLGLPPASKFRSGHLPTTAIPLHVDDSESGSDNGATTDSEEEGVYGGRYSLDSSPPDERIPSGTAQRYGNPLRREPHYASSDYTLSDVGSSMETLVGRHKRVEAERLARGAGRYPVGRNGYTEDESDDSAASSEFSTTQVGGSINGTVPRSRISEGYASSVPSIVNVESAAEKV